MCFYLPKEKEASSNFDCEQVDIPLIYYIKRNRNIKKMHFLYIQMHFSLFRAVSKEIKIYEKTYYAQLQPQTCHLLFNRHYSKTFILI